MCTVLNETKTEGQVFTPVGIVSMILDSVKYTGKTVLTKSIMEPSFGKGVFLIEIVSRIIHEGKAEGKAEGIGLALRDLLEARFGTLPQSVTSYIANSSDSNALRKLTLSAYHAESLQAFIDQQKAAQEHYLEDQYAIAKNAKLGVMPGGEVVMVMCENADTVYANIEKALK